MKKVDSIKVFGKEVLPLVEGGKGVSVTTGETAGAWAAAGGIGTFSGVNADFYDENGQIVSQVYHGKTRGDRHKELIEYGIKGGIAQAKIAHERSNGNGLIHMNVLWEMGGVQDILHGVLENTKGMIQGVTCGAGMPYKLSEICAKYGVNYYPIVSSARALRALWKRAYNKFSDFLGGVVYEDPWMAGGHNGLSNSEDPKIPQDPYPRLVALRKQMNEFGLNETPIIMAGGVWYLRDWEDYLDNPEIGPIMFQFGTRPLLTQESPIGDAWKKKLPLLKKGEIFLNRYSPTGFYSSAVNNDFIQELRGRSERQVSYSRKPSEDHTAEFPVGPRARIHYFKPDDIEKMKGWIAEGHDEMLKTPDDTFIFVGKERADKILTDQIECMGCLSACMFSNWSQHEGGTTGRRTDPRSFCIQKTLQDISHQGDIDHNLMFAGHAAYKFGQDPFYKDGFVPTVKQLVDRIMTGD